MSFKFSFPSVLFYVLLIALISISPSQLAIGQEYAIRQGDMIIITVLERQTLSGTFIVNASGNIALPPPVGNLKVAGLTEKQIAALVTEQIKEYVINPTVSIAVTPVEGFMVQILGEVLQPSFIRVVEGTRVQVAIAQAGGFTPLADKTRIQLKRTEKDASGREQQVDTVLDFLRFVESSELSANPPLKRGDVLIVPRLAKVERPKFITVMGAVANPTTVVSEEPQQLIQLLAQAGGVTVNARVSEISILSSISGESSRRKVNFSRFLTEGDLTANSEVYPGETVFVPQEIAEQVTVNVVGQVVSQGAYPVTDSSRLFDAISLAGGVAEGAALDKVIIIHPRPQSPIKEEVNLTKYLTSGDPRYNPPLVKGDTILVPMSEDAKIIPSIHTAFFPSFRVSIIGEVNRQDTYLVSSEVTLLDILKLGGGPTTDADLKRVTLIREQPGGAQQREIVNVDKVLTDGAFQLMPQLQAGDTVFVPKQKPKSGILRALDVAAAVAGTVTTIGFAYLVISGRRF